MAKIFKKLFVGDTVAMSGNKCFKKLTTENPNSIVGTWLLNDLPLSAPSELVTLTFDAPIGQFYGKVVYSTSNNTLSLMQIYSIYLSKIIVSGVYYGELEISNRIGDSKTYQQNLYAYNRYQAQYYQNGTSNNTTITTNTDARTLVFTKDPKNSVLTAWLNANATKIS